MRQLPPASTYGRLDNPQARVSYMNPPAQPQASAQNDLEALENLITYIASVNSTDLLVLLRQKGFSPAGYDMQSVEYATMQMLASGDAKQQEANLIDLLKIHPDANVILEVYGKLKHPNGCNCSDCKTPFFTKDRLLFIGLIILLFVAMYFITQND